MTRFKPVAALMAIACAALPSIAEAADDVAELRAELQALKSEYASRVGLLEARIEQLESAPEPIAAQVAQQQLPPAAGSRSAPSAFNPAISLIFAGNYTDVSQDPENWRVAGFMPSGGEVGPGERSFNLGESELVLSANVDPYFSATMIAAITGEDEIEVEEAEHSIVPEVRQPVSVRRPDRCEHATGLIGEWRHNAGGQIHHP